MIAPDSEVVNDGPTASSEESRSSVGVITVPFLSPLRRWPFVDEFQRLLDQDLAGHLAKRRARDVFVPRETLKIDLRQDVAEGVVGQAEQEVMLPAHLA